jgi:hypothetical protein
MKKLILFFLVLFTILYSGRLQSQSTNYVILSSVSDTTDPWYQGVKVLRDYRNAQVINFTPENLNLVLPALICLAPRYVAVFVKPLELQINFVREFMMMSTQLDNDPFSDFSYGFITGAKAPDALNYVNNIIYAETHNIQSFPLNTGGYVASSINFVYNGASGYMTYLEPPSASCIYLEVNDNGSGKNFFLANTGYMLNNKLLDIGHNGDPHMLWLFEGGNTNPNPPVWNYDPAKIENPAYARVGLTSSDIGSLNLYPAVAFNGACHSGETKTVMVEGDIAATFGDTQGIVEFYTMSDTFSYALNILKTGITGYFAPCGANNANDQGEDVYNAFLYHEPLGDIHKRSNDGVVMGFLGNSPNLKIYEQGESTYGCDVLASGSFNPGDWSGACYMLGGKANRIYFGDPLFNPYQDNHSDSLNIAKAVLDSVDANTFDIDVTFHKPDGFWPVWDKFHFSNTRIYVPVELPSYCADVTEFSVLGSSGPYDLVIHAVEHFDGKTILHIEADIPDDMYGVINYDIQFRITYVVSGMTAVVTEDHGTVVYPNPTNGMATVSFSNPAGNSHSLFVYDNCGKKVEEITNIRGNSAMINCSGELRPGIYFFTISNWRGIVAKGKVIIGHD